MKEVLYEWMVIPFGMTNAPNMFVILMNEVLKPFLGRFNVVYLDDILNFRQTREEHLSHIQQVLQKLSQDNLLVNLRNFSFM